LTDHDEGLQFLTDAFEIILEEALRKGTDRQEKVCEWRDPEELRALLDLDLQETGESHGRLLQRVRDVAKYSVKTHHPLFFNQLFAGVDYHSLAGRFLTETLNTSQYTYEVAPVFVLMEEVVLSELRSLVGWAAGDGIFCPGGSVSNMYAMNLARYRAFPEVKLRGLWAVPRLAVFTSQECHYSVRKSASFQGIGIENVHPVRVDPRGGMIPEDLEEKIELAKSQAEELHLDSRLPLLAPQGAVPFLVSATSGTTILGAFDPLDRIADVCEKHGLWLHVDNLLKRCHCANATYLFQQDKFYDLSYDTGDKSVQCGRKVDCLKLWLMWKAVGTRGLEERVDKAFAYTRFLVEEMKKREGFQLVVEPEFVNVCFWYAPPSLRGQEGSEDYRDRLAKVAPTIKERMVRKGSMMVGYQPQHDRVNFFRAVVLSPQLTRDDLLFFLDEIERLGSDL
ncbi:CSAD decarboxylase, partial [Atractosteus spatula]|nr:CSAD decarboxylase [Atractosteus spatula]